MSFQENFLEIFPPTVYKYRDWDNEKHRKTIELNKLWLSSPKGLNDPFDCQLPLIVDEEEIRSHEFLNFLLNDVGSLEVAQAKWKDILVNPKEYFKQWEPELLEMYLSFGVLSLCESPSNYLLWSHYANCHKGFCVGFNTERLVKEDIQGTFEKVKYQLNFPTFKFLEDHSVSFSKALATKHLTWAYEEEWRITKSYSADKEIDIGKKTITEIYLGAKMDQRSKDMVIKKQKHKNKSIKFYEMQLSTTSFEVLPIEI